MAKRFLALHKSAGLFTICNGNMGEIMLLFEKKATEHSKGEGEIWMYLVLWGR